MNFYRLVKPEWARPFRSNGEANPNFVKEINGPDVYEGVDYDQEFLTARNVEGYNVYFFPNHPSKNVYADGVKHLSGKHIDTFNFVFVDMDLKDKVYASKEEFFNKLASFPLKPTMTVDSGNGVHAYWAVDGLTRDTYVITQLALIHHFKTDESIYTVLQLMRCPGFYNTKKSNGYISAGIVETLTSSQRYTMEQLPQSLFAIPEDVAQRARRHLDKLDGKLTVDLGKDLNMDEIPDRFIDFIHDPKNLPVYTMFTDPIKSHGDKSKADMSLANVLYKAGFNKKEALAVLANTQKALSHPNRYYYSELTVDKAYTDKLNAKFLTVGQRLRTQGSERQYAPQVKGPWFFDTGVLGEPWRKKELLGLIAGPGVGKTSVTLKFILEFIINNPDNDDIFIFYSLEMTEENIISRWVKLVGETSPLADRLYVIGNEDADGTPRNIGMQEIHSIAEEIKKGTGKNIGAIAVDHIGLVARHIDTEKKPNFGIMSETEGGWGKIRTLSLNNLATQMKSLVKMLDCFGIILTQTTKGKGVGDLPIGKDGAYGISQYENIMDRIITVWQPLQRVQNQTKHRFLAWQYVKIRDKHVDDKIQTFEPKLLTFQLSTGDLTITTPEEYAEFVRLLPMAQASREKEEKKQAGGYSIHIDHSKIAEGLNALRNKTQGTQNEVEQVQPNNNS